MITINSVSSVTATLDPSSFVVVMDFTDADGLRDPACITVTRVGDTAPLNLLTIEWLQDNQGSYTVQPYTPPAPLPYQISKRTPWDRMTDDEAELITGAMQQANARQKAIYDAATYLSSGDPLWGALHEMIATTLNSSSRADELLAPET